MSEPTRQARTQEPEPEGGAMWAMLIGGAILVIAGLLIFWPGGDLATSGGKPGGRSGGNQAQSSQVSAGGAGGGGGGNGRFEVADLQGKPVQLKPLMTGELPKRPGWLASQTPS